MGSMLKWKINIKIKSHFERDGDFAFFFDVLCQFFNFAQSRRLQTSIISKQNFCLFILADIFFLIEVLIFLFFCLDCSIPKKYSLCKLYQEWIEWMNTIYSNWWKSCRRLKKYSSMRVFMTPTPSENHQVMIAPFVIYLVFGRDDVSLK